MPQWTEAFGRGEGNGESVRLPHIVRKVLVPYASLPVQLKVEDDLAKLEDPNVAFTEGGMCGAYIRTTGRTGRVTLTITIPRIQTVIMKFEVK